MKSSTTKSQSDKNLENIHLTKVENKNGGVVWESL